mmetsp:Transcript_85034/g.259725  ORF Transcript_85034/g.259725 Transcript_85034/m.259725 type:complete len:228 (+) Transcript_85034:2618-3301(+)
MCWPTKFVWLARSSHCRGMANCACSSGKLSLYSFILSTAQLSKASQHGVTSRNVPNLRLLHGGPWKKHVRQNAFPEVTKRCCRASARKTTRAPGARWTSELLHSPSKGCSSSKPRPGPNNHTNISLWLEKTFSHFSHSSLVSGGPSASGMPASWTTVPVRASTSKPNCCRNGMIISPTPVITWSRLPIPSPPTQSESSPSGGQRSQILDEPCEPKRPSTSIAAGALR